MCSWIALWAIHATKLQAGEVEWPKDRQELVLPSGITNFGRVMLTLKFGEASSEFPFALDSGARQSVITDQRCLIGLSLQDSGGVPVTGMAGVRQARLVKIPHVELGGLRLNDWTWQVMPMVVKGGASGIVGGELFRGHVIEIFYGGQQVKLIKREAYSPSKEDAALPLAFNQMGLPIVPIVIHGEKVNVMVDLGFDGFLMLFRPNIKDWGLAERPGRTVKGAGGLERAGAVALTLVRLGSSAFNHVEADVVSGGSRVFHGILGSQALARFSRVAIDFTGKVLYLSQNFSGDKAK